MLQLMPVNFKMIAPPAAPAISASSIPLAPPAAPAATRAKPQPPTRPAPAIAVGFGRDVPLEFAVRQVVPHWLGVSYSASVDCQARVSWHGGRPWNQVLGDLLTPLGLHMTMSGRTLRIRD